jgi:hypothetical protein
MEPPLPYQLLNEIRQDLSSGTFLYESAMQKLMQAGLDEERARNTLLSLAKEHRKELFQQKLQKQNSEGIREVTFLVIIMTAAVGPVFNVTSTLWYIVAVSIAGIAGYFSFKSQPVAGIIGSILVVILFPFTYEYYFSGRSSYIKIEFLIPALMAVIPAAIVAVVISLIFYPKRKNR